MMRCWDTIARTHHRKMNPQWQRGLWLWRVWREIWGELWWELGPQPLQHQEVEPAGDVSKWLACLTPPGHPGTQTTWSLTRFQWMRIGQWRWWEAVARQTLVICRMVWLNEQWKVCSFTVHCSHVSLWPPDTERWMFFYHAKWQRWTMTDRMCFGKSAPAAMTATGLTTTTACTIMVSISGLVWTWFLMQVHGATWPMFIVHCSLSHARWSSLFNVHCTFHG